jgi:hypothetical protein
LLPMTTPTAGEAFMLPIISSHPRSCPEESISLETLNRKPR